MRAPHRHLACTTLLGLLACQSTLPPTTDEPSGGVTTPRYDAPDAAVGTPMPQSGGDVAPLPQPPSATGGVVETPVTGGDSEVAQQDFDAGIEPPDAGPSDSPSTIPPSRCPDDRFLLCEGFESTPVGQPADPSLWTTESDTLRVIDSLAARGSRALQITTGPNQPLNFIRTTDLAGRVGDTMWGRIFLQVDTPLPAGFSHWTVVEATGVHPAGGTARMRVGGIHIPDVQNRLDFNYDIWGNRPANFHEVGLEQTTDFPRDRFVCLEWMFDVQNREVRVFVDGVEDEMLHARAEIEGIPLDFPPFDGLNIGLANYQPSGETPWRVTVDEVAVARSRIGCAE